MPLSDIGIIRMITLIYSSLTQYINTCAYIYIYTCGYIPRRDIVQYSYCTDDAGDFMG